MTPVRLAAADDVPAVARLLGDFHDHLGKRRPDQEELERRVRTVIDGGDGEFILGFAGEEPAGFIQLRYRWCVWTGAPDAWLEDLFVSGAHRRSGLGRALGKEAIERAGARGCIRLELDVDEDNDPALALYSALGFSDTSKGRARSLLLGTRVGPDS